MYQDPKLVRVHRVTTNLDQYEHNLLQAMADITGRDKSTLVREMVMREAVRLLGVNDNQSIVRSVNNTGAQ